jgi:AraC-like DNA-binding protein
VRELQITDTGNNVSEYFAECFIKAGRIRMPAGAADFTSLRFSTRGLPERMRIPMWREEFGRRIVHVDIEPSSDVPFQAEATLQAVQGLRTLAWQGSAMRFKRSQANIVDGDDSIGIIVCSPSWSQLSQRGQEIELRVGDAIALLHSEPAIVTYAEGLQFGLSVPRDALTPRVTNVDSLTMRPISRRTEALRLLMTYLKSALKEGALAAPKLRDTVVTHIHDLVALAISECAPLESSASAVVAARHSAALEHIAANFQDPELSLEVVARCQRISPRYLQHLMTSSGTSFTERVNELRLQRAFALLIEPRSAQRISDIALEVGFSDISHFNRQFRARFGVSPRGVRSAGRVIPESRDPDP